MNDPSAAIEGPTLIVQLPLWQLGIVIFAAISVVGSVWLTTRDLRTQVVGLKDSVVELGRQIGSFGTVVSRLRDIIARLRERIARLEAANGITSQHSQDDDMEE